MLLLGFLEDKYFFRFFLNQISIYTDEKIRNNANIMKVKVTRKKLDITCLWKNDAFTLA